MTTPTPDQIRTVASKYDEIAAALGDIAYSEAATYAATQAANLRKTADELDPPQPEWKRGDYGMNSAEKIWRYIGDHFWRCGIEVQTQREVELYGPLTRVRIAGENEVVVSVEGLNRDFLDQYADDVEGGSDGVAWRSGLRVAKAVRDQLGPVQP